MVIGPSEKAPIAKYNFKNVASTRLTRKEPPNSSTQMKYDEIKACTTVHITYYKVMKLWTSDRRSTRKARERKK